jgi:FkbM family methyltransferase
MGFIISTDKTHTRGMIRFYSQFIKEDDLCFDIGANLGNRTSIFSKLGATVVAVEPQEYCVKLLYRKFKKNDHIVIVNTALGERDGEGELMISDAHTISSFSEDWIDSVKASGRFSNYRWDRKKTVQMTTLDRLIEKYGRPVFCKIDVEGYELQVIRGLSDAIDCISFEFIPEFSKPVVDAVKHLSVLGNYKFNYSLGESMSFALSEWVSQDEIVDILLAIRDKNIYGDIYARLAE